MLVLTRKVGEKILVPQCQLTVTVLDIASSRVRLGVSAPPGVTVHREEVQKRISTKASLAVGETLMAARILIADPDRFLWRPIAGICVSEARPCPLRRRDWSVCRGSARLSRTCWFWTQLFLWGGGDGVLAVVHEEPALRPTRRDDPCSRSESESAVQTVLVQSRRLSDEAADRRRLGRTDRHVTYAWKDRRGTVAACPMCSRRPRLDPKAVRPGSICRRSALMIGVSPGSNRYRSQCRLVGRRARWLLTLQMERGTNTQRVNIAKDRRQSCLRRSPYNDLRTVKCEYERGVLTLRGTLATYYHKQLAQEAVRDVAEVRQVVNRIVVRPRRSDRESSDPQRAGQPRRESSFSPEAETKNAPLSQLRGGRPSRPQRLGVTYDCDAHHYTHRPQKTGNDASVRSCLRKRTSRPPSHS